MSLSEIRVNTTKTRTGVGTITYTETGPVITGIATASNFKTGSTNVHSTGVELTNINTGGATATFGGAISGTSATLSGALSGTTASFSGNVSIGGTLTYEDVTNIDSVGILTARQGINVTGGTVTIPTWLVHSGDPNTKFGFEGPDTITFETAGSEALRITSEGKLGINYGSPVSIIHAIGNSTVGTSVTMTLQSHDTANATAGINLLARDNSNNNETCKIQAVAGGQETVDLQFHTNNTERFRITSHGGHNIYNDSSYNAVNLAECDTENLALNIRKTRNGQTKAIALGAIGSSGQTGIQAYDSSDDSANNLLINPFGAQVVINTTSPVSGNNYATLHVGGDASSSGGGNVLIGNLYNSGLNNPKNCQLTLAGQHNSTGYNADGQVKLYITGSDNDGGAVNYPVFCEDENANVQMVLKQNGNNVEMGLGTRHPHTPDGSVADNPLNGTPIFTMYGDSPAINLVSSTTTSSDWSLINFGRTGSTSNPYRAVIGYHQSADILRINANNAITFDTGGDINSGEAARFTSSGRFGLGTTSPDHIFEVESNNSSIAVSRSGSNAQLLFKSNSVGQAGQIQVDESSGGGYMDFYTKNTSGSLIKRLSMDTSGRLQTYGTLGVGNLPLAGNAADAALHIRSNNKYKGIALGENAVSGTIGMGGDDTSTALVYTANAHPANLGGGEQAVHEWWSGSSGGGGPSKLMVLTNAGNLGIGTWGPDADLDVGGSAPQIRMTNTATSRSYFSWYNHYGGLKRNADISYNEGNANWEFKLYRADSQANSPYGNIQFFTGSTSSPTLAMNITRPGSVTMPKQPCCVMYASSSVTWSSGWTKIPLNNTYYDIGNNFDSSNNRYTIPVTGKYAIGYNVELNIGNGQTWIYFVPRINRNDTTSKNAGINYADFAPMSNNSSNHYYSKQGHWIASLGQGDTVTWEMHGAGNAWTVNNNNQSHYYIYQVA